MKEQGKSGQRQENLFDKTRKILNEIRNRLNESKEEAIVNFEKEKKEFGKLVANAQERIDELGKESKSQAQKLQASLDELQVQLALGKADTLDELDRQTHNIEASFRKFKDRANNAFQGSSKNIKVAWNRFAQQLEEERENIETNIKLHKMQFEEERDKNVKKRKEELNKRIEQFQEYIKENRDRTETKVRNISDELNNKLDEIKKKLAS